MSLTDDTIATVDTETKAIKRAVRKLIHKDATKGAKKKPGRPARIAQAPKPPVPTAREVMGYDYHFGNSLDDASLSFGHDVVFKLFKIAANQQLADYIRWCVTPTSKRPAMTAGELAQAVREWKPVLKKRGKSSIEKASKFVAQMTPGEKADLIRMLQGFNDPA